MIARLVAVDEEGSEGLLGEYTFNHTRTLPGPGARQSAQRGAGRRFSANRHPSLPSKKTHERIVGYSETGRKRVPFETSRLCMERLREAGAGFRSLSEANDTTTPAGRMMMQMVGAFAEFKRAMLKERTKAGFDSARACPKVAEWAFVPLWK
jgi:hypothetical protein